MDVAHAAGRGHIVALGTLVGDAEVLVLNVVLEACLVLGGKGTDVAGVAHAVMNTLKPRKSVSTSQHQRG